jgi:beta-galactosidase
MNAGYQVRGGIYLQSYVPTTGKPVGHFDDGRIAVVDNVFGRGRTRLIGTFPGYGYAKRQDKDMNRFFTDLLPWADKTQHLKNSDNRVIARIQKSDRATYLWLVNSLHEAIETEVILSRSWGPYQRARSICGEKVKLKSDRLITTSIPPRSVVIVLLT